MLEQRVQKKKMATIREVYDRILWDARLDRSAFAIGYIERMSVEGIREKPFSEWSTDGDIPMHRIRFPSVSLTYSRANWATGSSFETMSVSFIIGDRLLPIYQALRAGKRAYRNWKLNRFDNKKLGI